MLPKPLQYSSCFSLSAWKSAVCVISGLWSKSPWSDVFWPEVLDGVQRVSGLVWRKVGPRQFRDSQNIRISSQNFSFSISCTEDTHWTHSASLQWYRDRGGLVLLKMLLAHLSLHLEPATAFPIWNLALAACVAHVLCPLWSLCPETPTYLWEWLGFQMYSCFWLHNHQILFLFPGCWWK